MATGDDDGGGECGLSSEDPKTTSAGTTDQYICGRMR